MGADAGDGLRSGAAGGLCRSPAWGLTRWERRPTPGGGTTSAGEATVAPARDPMRALRDRCEPGRPAARRRDALRPQRLERGSARGPTQSMIPEKAAQLDEADALRRDSQNDPGQARARFAQLEGLQRTAAGAQLGGEAVETVGTAGGERVRSELGAERRVDQQALDQLAGAIDVLLSEGHDSPLLLRTARA